MTRRGKRRGDGSGAMVARVADEASLALWFGGAAMGALGLRRGAEAAKTRRLDVESSAWAAWQPAQTAAIAAQVVSGAALTIANRHRVVGQRGVLVTSLLRTGVLAAAIATTAVAARAGRDLVESDAGAHRDRPDESALRRLQWATVALTGSLVVLDAVMGEQQRPQHVARGFARRLLPDALTTAHLPEIDVRDLRFPELHLPQMHLPERLARSA